MENNPARSQKRGQYASFNGATANPPWKTATWVASLQQTALLQWGHGESAVENITSGPKPVSTSLLQWGHGESAVENAAKIREKA